MEYFNWVGISHVIKIPSNTHTQRERDTQRHTHTHTHTHTHHYIARRSRDDFSLFFGSPTCPNDYHDANYDTDDDDQ